MDGGRRPIFACRKLGLSTVFFLPGRTWRATSAKRWIHTQTGGAQPGRMNSHASALAAAEATARGPREPPLRHGRPAPHPYGRRPQAACAVHCTTRHPRTLVPARSIKSTPLSNPEGLRRSCATGQHAQHFGLFIPRRLAHTMLHSTLGTSAGPCHHHGYPQRIVVPGSPVNSGSQPEGCGNTIS